MHGLTIKTVTLVRHGETEWNRLRRRQGQLDSPLSERGLVQARLFPGELDRRAQDKYRWRFRNGESYADADRRAGIALERISTAGAERPLIVSHEMIGRMLLRHLLSADPMTALGWRHPHDVIYQVAVDKGEVTELRVDSRVR